MNAAVPSAEQVGEFVRVSGPITTREYQRAQMIGRNAALYDLQRAEAAGLVSRHWSRALSCTVWASVRP
jgi:hypothetical protein